MKSKDSVHIGRCGTALALGFEAGADGTLATQSRPQRSPRMHSKAIARKLTAITIACFIFLLGDCFSGSAEENRIPVRLPAAGGADNPLKLLNGFSIVPGAAVLVAREYVIALFKNPEKDLYALVSFSADCDSQSCTIKDLVTYTLFGKTEPQFVPA